MSFLNKYFHKYAINIMKTNEPIFYRHPDLYKWAKEAYDKGDNHFYCHNSPDGSLVENPHAKLIKDDGPHYNYLYNSHNGNIPTKEFLEYLVEHYDLVENAKKIILTIVLTEDEYNNALNND